VPFISSNPDAWMRPYYEAVAAREGFSLLPIPLQFGVLISAIAVDYPTRVGKLRQIVDLPSQRAMLLSLSNVVYRGPAAREVELWRVRKDSRELRCLAVYMPTGIDLRLIEGEDFRRTQLLRDGPALEARAAEWRAKLLAAGWS
jgi:hypothetical protein